MSFLQADIDTIKDLYDQQPENHVWIDVRRPDEWAEGTIPGVERIVLDDLPSALDNLDKSKTYVMVCRSGGRSGRACEAMSQAGFSSLINFDGGMLDWYDSGFDLEK